MATVISGDTGVSQVQNNIVSPAKLTQPLTLGTAQNTTSGTSIDFTGIPSWAKRITVTFNGVSTNGASLVLVQLGAGSITTSGYFSGTTTGNAAYVTTVPSAAGHVLSSLGLSSYGYYGSCVFTKISENIWSSTSVVRIASDGTTSMGASGVTLSGTLDRIRITTVNGTDTFDAGYVNILYEG